MSRMGRVFGRGARWAALAILLALTPSALAGTGPEKEITLIRDKGPDDMKPTLSRGKGARVRWSNQDVRGHTITFTDWPFVEPPEAIRIAAGEKSRWYTVYSDEPKTSHEYAIDPPIKKQVSPSTGNGPPDVPCVVVDE
jgi:hypothetical protein